MGSPVFHLPWSLDRYVGDVLRSLVNHGEKVKETAEETQLLHLATFLQHLSQ